MKNIIKRIELDLDGKRVSLTPQQARNLKVALEELFGAKEVVREEHHHHDSYPWYAPNYPVWPYPAPTYTWPYMADRITISDAKPLTTCVGSYNSDTGTVTLSA